MRHCEWSRNSVGVVLNHAPKRPIGQGKTSCCTFNHPMQPVVCSRVLKPTCHPVRKSC
jgi:hypothetical protein